MQSVIKKTFTVEGMHCGSCAVSTGMILENIPGVITARVDFDAKTAGVEYDSGQVTVSNMNKAVEGLVCRLKGASDD
ncbi:MAG: heavy-metal-associated domain-containing protein [Pseudomonadota bacterium]